MAISRGVGTAVLAILAVLVVIAAIVFAAKFIGGNTPIQPLILNTLDIRKDVDPLAKAKAVSLMDDLVAQANNEALSDQWARVGECLSAGCPDEAYFDLILVVAAENEKIYPKSPILINLIAAHRYWDSDDVIELSKAVSYANEQIENVDKRRAEKIWEEILECNGCEDMNNLFFDLIETIVQP